MTPPRDKHPADIPADAATPAADGGAARAPDAQTAITPNPAPGTRPDKIRCDACPVMCYVADGQTGACDRYANRNGRIIRCDPLTILDHAAARGTPVKPFLNAAPSDDLSQPRLTAIGAGTTYPDYKPAPFIISQPTENADTITVVTEAIYSYCGVKIKIDTDRHLGPEGAIVTASGEPVGLVITSEYGSQMLSLGGVDHLTGGTKPEGRATCDALLNLCNGHPVTLLIAQPDAHPPVEIIVQAGKPPIIDGTTETRMRVGCGSATIGMFASQWKNLVDEVVVVDDHITGVVSEHQAGKHIDWPDTGIRIKGRRSTPGRYFRVADPGQGWGGTDIDDPLDILNPWLAKKGARPGLTLLMVSTTGEHAAYYILDDDLTPQPAPMPAALRASVDLIAENCEPALCTVLFCAGAGGSLRSGVTRNPVRLTRAVHAGDVRVTLGGAPAYLWPGGGITLMADVTELPPNSFGYVPTPALVAPIEFTLSRETYADLGGHLDAIRTLADVLKSGGEYTIGHRTYSEAKKV